MCRRCGGEMRDEWKFCPSCGTKKLAPPRERRRVVSKNIMEEDWDAIRALPFSEGTRDAVEQLCRHNRAPLADEHRAEMNRVFAASGQCYRVVVNQNSKWWGDHFSETIYMICKTEPKP
jgi:hypothetical protein